MKNKNKKKKVLIIVENLPVPHDRRVWQEAQSLNSEGYSVAVICPKGKGYNKKYEDIDGIHIYRHPLPLEARKSFEYILEYSIAFFWESILAWKVLIKHGFDVIQACNPPDNIFLIAWFFKTFFRKKFIFDHHDGNPEVWVSKGGRKNGFIYKLLLFLEKSTFRTAHLVYSVNDTYKNIAIERGGIDKDRVLIVRNSPRKMDIDQNKIEGQEYKTKERYTVGYLGVMGKQDGIDNLLEGIRHLVYENGRKDIFFKLMGDGPELDYLKKLTTQLGLNEFVEFTGWISGQEYINHLFSCDVCVNADIVDEYNMYCSPNKIYEYMYFAKPIVQFEMTESKIVADKAAVYAKANDYTDLTEKVAELLDSPSARKEMGQFGRKQFLDNFTWEKSSINYLKGYEKILINKN